MSGAWPAPEGAGDGLNGFFDPDVLKVFTERPPHEGARDFQPDSWS